MEELPGIRLALSREREKRKRKTWPTNAYEMGLTPITQDARDRAAQAFSLFGYAFVTLKEVETAYMQTVLQRHHGDIRAAAVDLGMKRSTLLYRIKAMTGDCEA